MTAIPANKKIPLSFPATGLSYICNLFFEVLIFKFKAVNMKNGFIVFQKFILRVKKRSPTLNNDSAVKKYCS